LTYCIESLEANDDATLNSEVVVADGGIMISSGGEAIERSISKR